MQITVRTLLTKDTNIAALMTALLAALDASVGILDAGGILLAGRDDQGRAQRHPVIANDQVIGWVVGDERARAVAALVTYVAARTLERRNLAHEVLACYRELNLLYGVSETIGASLQVATVAAATIGEARRLITADAAQAVLYDAQAGVLRSLVAIKDDTNAAPVMRCGEGIIGSVVQSGRAETVNDVHADPRRSQHEHGFRSLLCAPFRARQRVIGALVVGSAEAVSYSAADLKLLSTIASQAAPAIDNALLHEQMLRDAREREQHLRQQLATLQIEVDHAREAQQVAAITGTAYFQTLRQRAHTLRQDLTRAGSTADGTAPSHPSS